LILFKMTDVPTTYKKMTEAGYEVTFGRRLFMDTEEALVTNDVRTLSVVRVGPT
jgi:precorrin-2/cobalt-factor-2 C20-methyltransferase